MFSSSGSSGIQLTEDGSTISGTSQERILWSDIVEIVAFKRDLWSHDEICLGIRTIGSEQCLIVSEESEGFTALTEEVSNRFELTKDWWSKVAFPAFVENWTRLWPPEISSTTLPPS
jgi:hypothetical protein